MKISNQKYTLKVLMFLSRIAFAMGRPGFSMADEVKAARISKNIQTALVDLGIATNKTARSSWQWRGGVPSESMAQAVIQQMKDMHDRSLAKKTEEETPPQAEVEPASEADQLSFVAKQLTDLGRDMKAIQEHVNSLHQVIQKAFTNNQMPLELGRD